MARPQRRTRVLSTGVPGGLPVVHPVPRTVQDLGDEQRHQTFFGIKVGSLSTRLCTWVGHLGHWRYLQRTKRLKMAGDVPYVPVPT